MRSSIGMLPTPITGILWSYAWDGTDTDSSIGIGMNGKAVSVSES